MADSLLKKLNAEEALKQAEILRIKTAQNRTQGYIDNSGGNQGNLEDNPGASGTGDVLGGILGGHTEKKKSGLNPS